MNKMRKSIKKQFIILITVIISAFLMALNTKTFVNTGGLYPGGVTGLTILIQRIFKLLLDITLPFSVVNIFLNSIPGLHRFPIYWKKIYALFMSYDYS